MVRPYIDNQRFISRHSSNTPLLYSVFYLKFDQNTNNDENQN